MDAAHARRADMSAGARFGELLRHVDPASQWAIKRFLIKLAVLQRERCGGGVLNHWDEAAAFTALCALAHVAKAAIG